MNILFVREGNIGILENSLCFNTCITNKIILPMTVQTEALVLAHECCFYKYRCCSLVVMMCSEMIHLPYHIISDY